MTQIPLSMIGEILDVVSPAYGIISAKTTRHLLELIQKQLQHKKETNTRPQAALPKADASDFALLAARIHSISGAIAYTFLENATSVPAAVDLLKNWISGKQHVRVLGAGRALLAASMAANRLAHAGATVSFMGGMVPLPNSLLGGGIISCSASGRTKPVLEAMQIAREKNPEIRILGLAAHNAMEFSELCDVFIGLHVPKNEYPNPLSALADTEEQMISEILDSLVVLAGRQLGFDDTAWRKGHEDIGPTGPYAPLPH